MLANILFNTIAVPFVAGLVLAIVVSFSRTNKDLAIAALFPIVAALIFGLLEGMPSFPPVGAKQKLPYLLLLVSALSSVVVLSEKRTSARVQTAIFWAATNISMLWIGQNVLLSNPGKFAIAEAVVLISFVATYLAARGPAIERNLKSSIFIPASLSACLGFAILSALGAFLGMAQANGALAALLGAMALISWILLFNGRPGLTDLSLPALLAISATTSLFSVFSILFAPKSFQTSALLVSVSLMMPSILASLGAPTLLKWQAPLRFVVCGIATTLPTLLAISLAAISAF